MPDIVLTLAEIRELGQSLRLIAAEFDNSEDIAEEYAEIVGHDDLAHELEEFADNWSNHRRALMENLQGLAEAAQTAAEGYDGIERDLVDALEGNA
ncbi:hypothetical protein RM780_10960 [Streptomyces sp. DSM 44917]|uniref:PE domain-containing protein n=1 Tax=Streptomyces boetiae TaxID=3075541 RepID=A0ABU2L7K6_9ACTN|nr:hypothetical protein [Streptomyces sp. DSM 44917]MDT0307482.1 hypothetical protein [Streptomyces sp. DSM 44917]